MNTILYENFIDAITNNQSFDKEFVLGALLLNSVESTDNILFVSGLVDKQILYLRRYINYFGYDFKQVQSWDELYTLVDDKIKQINNELERLRRERWNAWYNKLIRNIKMLLLWIVIIPFVLFPLILLDLLFFVPLALIKFCKQDRKSQTVQYTNNNYIIYSEGASGNTSTQKITLIDGDTGQEKVSITDKTKIGLANKLAGYILISNFEKFNSKVLTYLHNLGIKIRNIPYLSDTIKFRLIATVTFITILYLATNTTFKLIILGCIITLSGFIINLSQRTYSKLLRENNPVQSSKDLAPSNLSITPTIDSLNVKKIDDIITVENIDEPIVVTLKPILAYQEYYEKVQEVFANNTECTPLAEMGLKQLEFIELRDLINHSKQEYYVDKPNGDYYLHVVLYNTVQQAAFQVHHLNINTQFKAQILPVDTKEGETLFAVTIGNHRGIEVNDLCELADEWITYCNKKENNIGIYYNG